MVSLPDERARRPFESMDGSGRMGHGSTTPGMFIPPEVMPESVRRISQFLPLTYAVELLRGLWFGAPWSDFLRATAVLLGVLIVCTVAATRFFRWE